MATTIARDQTPDNTSEGQAYGLSNARYEEKADKKLKTSETLVLAGYGITLKVTRDGLFIKNGLTHDNQGNREQTLYRGVHGIAHIIILAKTGNITLDALNWCKEQEIAVTMIDRDGSLFQAITPTHTSNAVLRRAQYRADDEKAGQIACAIVRLKLIEQQATLAKHSELPQGTRAHEIFTDILTWFDMPQLPARYYDVDFLRTVEGRAAKAYFESWVGLPLKWEKTDRKSVPPNCLTVAERTSPLASNEKATHPVNPAQPILNSAYAILESQCLQALTTYGFDTSCGFLHADKVNRDSKASECPTN